MRPVYCKLGQFPKVLPPTESPSLTVSTHLVYLGAESLEPKGQSGLGGGGGEKLHGTCTKRTRILQLRKCVFSAHVAEKWLWIQRKCKCMILIKKLLFGLTIIYFICYSLVYFISFYIIIVHLIISWTKQHMKYILVSIFKIQLF